MTQIKISPESITISTNLKITKIAPNDITKITIETTDEGPLVEDVWLVFSTKTDIFRLPQSSFESQSEMLFAFLGNFENFDFSMFIQAMSCSEKQVFLCWQTE